MIISRLNCHDNVVSKQSTHPPEIKIVFDVLLKVRYLLVLGLPDGLVIGQLSPLDQEVHLVILVLPVGGANGGRSGWISIMSSLIKSISNQMWIEDSLATSRLLTHNKRGAFSSEVLFPLPMVWKHYFYATAIFLKAATNKKTLTTCGWVFCASGATPAWRHICRTFPPSCASPPRCPCCLPCRTSFRPRGAEVRPCPSFSCSSGTWRDGARPAGRVNKADSIDYSC